MTVASTPPLPPQPIQVADPRAMTPAGPAGLDVLVIDDDETVRGVLSEVLRQNGYSFLSAGDGKSAMALLSRQRFRLVVTDIYMPGMDGLELIMNYTATNPNALILAISGGCRGNFAESSLRPAQLLGSRRTLAKPFELKEFLAVVREMLGTQPA
jgi:CheY-like chemotaxis protein